MRRWCFAAAALALGCQPNIGDPCKLHTDCSAQGTRICEPNLPGGYCTIFNCEPGKCPDDAVCVAYGVAPSSKRECAVQQIQRLERSFCMAKCSKQSDCRSGYECVDLYAYNNPNDPSPTDQPNPWNAAVLDTDRGTKICTVPLSQAAKLATVQSLANSSAEVCLPPPDASFPPVPPPSDAGKAPGPDGARDAAPDVSSPGPSVDAAVPDARGTP